MQPERGQNAKQVDVKTFRSSFNPNVDTSKLNHLVDQIEAMDFLKKNGESDNEIDKAGSNPRDST